MNSRLFSFVGCTVGPLTVTSNTTITGPAIEDVRSLDIIRGEFQPVAGQTAWVLRGVTSNLRYVTEKEKQSLAGVQEPIGRSTSNRAAFIPIRKNAEWWSLSQGERRKILEETSKHITIGMDYLPAIARRLHHCRDLATAEPFDFLTLFEFADQDETAFDELLGKLRNTEEWTYIDREVDIRLRREQ